MKLQDAIAAYKLDYPQPLLRAKTLDDSISGDDEANCFDALANLLLPDGIISGLGIAVDGSNNAIVQPGTWQIDRVQYSTLAVNTLPLDVQDPSLKRYDVIYADIAGAVNILSGDLSADPIEPAIPTGTLKIAAALIIPTGISIITPPPNDFVDLSSDQTIFSGIKTFIKSPQVPNGISGGDAVNIGQIAGMFNNGIGSTGSNTYGLAGSLMKNTSITTGAFSFGIIGNFTVSGAPVNPNDVVRLQDVYLPDRILSGLGLTLSGSNVIIAAGTWRINKVIFNKGTSTTIALDAQDVSQSRFDLIYADNAGAINKVSGTLAVNPDVPATPGGAVAIGTVLITPTDITTQPAPITDYVNLTTDQLINGKKTFTYSPIVPFPILGTQAVNANWVSAFYQPIGLYVIYDNIDSHNFNLQLTPAFATVDNAGSATINGPQGTIPLTDTSHPAVNYAVVNHKAYGTRMQIVASTNGSPEGATYRKIWFRTGFSNVFDNTWYQFWHTGNLDPSTFGSGHYVALGGDTMTGPLMLSADPTVNLEAATKQYVDTSITNSAVVFASGQLSGAGTTGSPYRLGNTAITGQLLTGLSLSTGGAISATDSALIAFGKLQNQITSGGGGGSGTVTTLSVVSANGFTGSVANATTTPAITLTLQNATTSLSGQLTSADWNTFNGKQAALLGTGFVKSVSGTISYDTNTYLTTGAASSTYMPLGGGTFTGDVQQATAPLNSTSLINKGYVDNLIAGLQFIDTAVVAASIANVNVSSAPASLDGIAGTSGVSRWLLKNQTTASENGVYLFNGTGSALTRTTDASTGTQLANKTIPVSQGSTQADTWWTITNDTITIGTTAITIVQTAGSGTYTNGAGIGLSGNIFTLDTTYTKGLLSATSPIFYNSTTGVISSQAATTFLNGYLTSTDWNTFNNKQASGNYVTSISLTTPNILYTTPINWTVTSGAASATLSLITQTANTILAGPASGGAAAPTFRQIVIADHSATGTPSSTTYLRGDNTWASISASNSINVYNVKNYGAVGDGVTDDTAAIQSCINACDTGGGGVVYFPNSVYIIAGAINPTYNSQLYIPFRVVTGTSRSQITFLGESSNSIPNGGGLLGASSVPNTTSGAILKSTLATFTTAGQAVIGTKVGFVNSTYLSAKNLTIYVAHNPASSGPVVGGISWKNGYDCQFDNIACSIDIDGYSSTLPSNDVTGIELPDNGANEDYIISNCIVVGFRSGYKFGEHAMFHQASAMCCYYGLNIKSGYHNSGATRACLSWCAYDIFVSGSAPIPTLANFNIDAEWQVTGTKWYDSVNTIYDNSNLLTGQVFYTIIEASVGLNNSRFSMTGGTNSSFHVAAHTSGVVPGNITNLMAIGAQAITGATAGSVLYVGAAGVLGQDNANYFYDYTNHRLGLGTTTPASQLEIKGSPIITLNAGASSPATINYTKAGTSKWQVGQDFASNGTADYYIFDVVNTKVKFYSDPSGNTNIGGTATATATSAIHIDPSNNITANLGTFTVGALTAASYGTVTGAIGASGTLTLTSTSNVTKGKILFGNSAYDEVNNRLGIGLSSPTALLHLSSTGGTNKGLTITATSASSYSDIDFVTDQGLAGQFLMTGSTFSSGILGGNELMLFHELSTGKLSIGTLSALPVRVVTNNLERFAVTGAGNWALSSTAATANQVPMSNGTIMGWQLAPLYRGEGQVALVAGTKTISVTGVTSASSHGQVSLVSLAGTIATTQWYQITCGAGSITITAMTTSNTVNTLDTSTVNYFVTG